MTTKSCRSRFNLLVSRKVAHLSLMCYIGDSRQPQGYFAKSELGGSGQKLGWFSLPITPHFTPCVYPYMSVKLHLMPYGR